MQEYSEPSVAQGLNAILESMILWGEMPIPRGLNYLILWYIVQYPFHCANNLSYEE